jgi:chromosome segregation ATPase
MDSARFASAGLNEGHWFMFMIEPFMYFGLGFLGAALLGLIAVPLVHNRAARLTRRRIDASIPTSIVRIQTDKDKLRAEFAMAARRLEMSVETLKTKSFSQLLELDKKADIINRLKAKLGEATAAVTALEARDKALRDQLRTAEEEISIKTNAMLEAERAHSDKTADLTRLIGEFDRCSKLADSQKVEITALRAQIEVTKARDAIFLSMIGKHGARHENGHNGTSPPISVDVLADN